MSSDEVRFNECWQRDAPRVLAYARRHIGAEEAPDVVADTFLAAWRRWSSVPEPPIGWLLVTARHVIRNRGRSVQRHRALTDRIALLDGVAAFSAHSADMVLTRREALERLAALDEQQREALLLVSWDGLTNDEAAAVLGIRPATFRRRLSRARAALTAPAAPSDPGPRLVPSQELS